MIGDMVVHFETVEGEDHGYFGSVNDDWFMNILHVHTLVLVTCCYVSVFNVLIQ